MQVAQASLLPSECATSLQKGAWSLYWRMVDMKSLILRGCVWSRRPFFAGRWSHFTYPSFLQQMKKISELAGIIECIGQEQWVLVLVQTIRLGGTLLCWKNLESWHHFQQIVSLAPYVHHLQMHNQPCLALVPSNPLIQVACWKMIHINSIIIWSVNVPIEDLRTMYHCIIVDLYLPCIDSPNM